MAKNLVIVESPAKAKTIEGFLGADFQVKSSYGHIRDLIKGNHAVKIEADFEPVYEVSADKKAVIDDLKKLVSKAEMVWLASDEDREGEAISWHLHEVLNLTEKKTKRIVFHEITKPAITKAIQNPRKIDYNLVNAQQARRVLDRLVGFELSPVLWKKVKPSLSAGRVQSVAVRLIVEREREVQAHQSQADFKVSGLFKAANMSFKAELNHRFEIESDAYAYINKCKDLTFVVESVEKRPAKKSPAAPFTTSTLQQEASRKLRFSVKRTMTVAQRLYESGKITYMRTDSVNLSETALAAAQNEINTAFGEKYHQKRNYKTKSASAQEAHEAIRPTYFEQHQVGGERDEQLLYDLIWKRAIASQMADAELERTTIKLTANQMPYAFVAQGEVILFDGFLKVYLEDNDDEDVEEQDSLLPAVKKGENIAYQSLQAVQRFTRPAPRYTEASLVKKLEELGIGRPSTYAPTISTIQDRGYVVKGDKEGTPRSYVLLEVMATQKTINKIVKTEMVGTEKAKLFPSDIGMLVNDFLVENFPNILDFGFTAKVELDFDEIANGRLVWQQMMKEFYFPFHQDVVKTLEQSQRVTGERELGINPLNGKMVSVRMGKFGPIAQQLSPDKPDEKPDFSSLAAHQSLETITLEEALELFKLPRTLGDFEGKTVVAAVGKFGHYLRHDSKFVSIPKSLEPLSITLDEACALIEQKRKLDAEKLIANFPEAGLQILNGRWGPYLTDGKNNYKIPKTTDATTLTQNDCLALVAAADVPKPVSKKAALTSNETAPKPKTAKTTSKATSAKTSKTTSKASAAKTTPKKPISKNK